MADFPVGEAGCCDGKRVARDSRCRPWVLVLLFLLITAACVTFQIQAGGGSSDLGGDPDEAAHAVTSLMVRDYLVHGFGLSPLRFAEDYYVAFPKVALGHYPPGYYLIAGLLLVPWPALEVLFVLQAMLAAVLALGTFAFGRRWIGTGPASAAALLILLLPLTQKLLLLVMADFLLAVLCLASAAAWARYLEKPLARWSLGFGLLAAMAILTKGSGLMLALVPPVATALTGRWALMKRLDWWLAAVPVALIAGPWMLFSVRYTQEGMQHLSPWAFLPEAAAFYASALPATIGYALTGALLLVLIAAAIGRIRGRNLASPEAVAWSMLVGGSAVLLLVPAGTSSRYLMPEMAPMLLLVAGGVAAALRRFPERSRWMMGTVCVIVVAVDVVAPPAKEVSGYGSAVSALLAAAEGTPDKPEVWVVSADPRGEGAVIAAAAFGLKQRVPSPLRVLRGSKELASSDWMGRGYQSRFASEAELLEHLDKQSVQAVFVDDSLPTDGELHHHALLSRALRSDAGQWALQLDQEVIRGPDRHLMKIYRRVRNRNQTP